jgi:hypothetical protein
VVHDAQVAGQHLAPADLCKAPRVGVALGIGGKDAVHASALQQDLGIDLGRA